MRLAEQKEITACLSNTCITDIFYIINKHAGREKARGFIADILDTFRLVDIDGGGFRQALAENIAERMPFSTWPAPGTVCDVLATRNKADYGGRPEVLDPAELIQRIKTAGI